ncbi:hypothetical protein Cgig2_026141 [Carnegiea gigantea]|uniref:Uncharacterized protein n=1 Tax=Carnegiea gigantea TaxID=171969 RepID=A0A9Q1Q959_9CARY|nr:hypothetical protein Cgig2_026141 [Carnegiea gigantea]
MALKNTANTGRAKQKLDFNDAALTSEQRPKIVSGASPKNMILDDVVLAVPGNKEEFGNVDVEIKKLEELLKGQRDACSLRDTVAKIQEWRRKEEMLWWQRARLDYLNFGDSNTRWFHSRANMRRAMNFVQGLKDIDESDVHVVLECPLAERIWSATSVDKGIWGGRFSTVWDYVECAAHRLGPEELGESIAILLDVLGDRVVVVVRSFREAKEQCERKTQA